MLESTDEEPQQAKDEEADDEDLVNVITKRKRNDDEPAEKLSRPRSSVQSCKYYV